MRECRDTTTTYESWDWDVNNGQCVMISTVKRGIKLLWKVAFHENLQSKGEDTSNTAQA